MRANQAQPNAYRAAIAKAANRQLHNGFETLGDNTVFWTVVCWEALNEVSEQSVVRPLSTEDLAKWAIGVLAVRYPGREYTAVRQTTHYAVETAQMAALERSVLDELTRLELASKYSAPSD
ncbi:MAG: hypothetical protein ACRES5_10510 [Pseudomonas sp.]